MNPMSKEELRIEIAKMLEWTEIENAGAFELCGRRDYKKYGYCYGKIPDYPNDIKAAYELEGSVPEEKRLDYVDSLTKVIVDGSEFIELLRLIGNPDPLKTAWMCIHATPEQRCRAYVMTMRTSNNDRDMPIP